MPMDRRGQRDEQEALNAGADHREVAGIGYNLLRVGGQNSRTANTCYDWKLIKTLKPFHINLISIHLGNHCSASS